MSLLHHVRDWQRVIIVKFCVNLSSFDWVLKGRKMVPFWISVNNHLSCMCLSVRMYVYISVCVSLSVCLSVFACLSPYVCLALHLSISLRSSSYRFHLTVDILLVCAVVSRHVVADVVCIWRSDSSVYAALLWLTDCIFLCLSVCASRCRCMKPSSAEWCYWLVCVCLSVSLSVHVCVCMSGCLSQVQHDYAEFQRELVAAAAAAPVAGMSAATLVTGVPTQSKSTIDRHRLIRYHTLGHFLQVLTAELMAQSAV